MKARYLAIGSLALAASIAGSSALSALHKTSLRPPVAPGSARLYAVGVRAAAQPSSPASSKLGGVLADLARHVALVRPDHALADLHALSPAARFTRSSANGTPMVAIDAVTRGDPQALKGALVSLGLEHPAVYLNDVGGWMPVDQLESAAARGEVLSLRAAMPHKRAAQGPVATQGDYAQGSSVLRTDYPTLTGSGVTVGVLSDSFNCYAQYAAPDSGVPVSGAEGYAYNGFNADYASDVTTGALPAVVKVFEEADCSNYLFPDSAGQPTGLPFSDEGRAMLQIVHAIAPGASLAFYTGDNSEADFANGIQALANAGAKVIADDLGYYDEPFFQDGLLAQAIDTVESQGVAYFSAAGNDQETPSYMNSTPSFGTLSSSVPNAGEYLLNFDATGATLMNSLPVTISPLSPGDFVAVVVEWDQPYVTGSPDSGGASSQIDLCLTGATGSDVLVNYDNTVASCSGPNAVGSDPYQVMIIANPAVGSSNTASETINIQIGLVNGTMPPGRIIVDVEDDGQGSTINQFSPNGPTLQGHPGAAGAAAVGAAFYFDTPRCGTSPATLEPYSSAGGAPILFSTTGARLAAQIVRQKPDFVGPDGVNNTFLGFTLASDSPPYPSNGLLTTAITECQNNPSYPNFFGTSAATPHAAAIAALMLQANSAVTPSAIYGALRSTAVAMPVTTGAGCSATPNYCSGYGFIQAGAALSSIPPGAPKLTLSAASIAADSSATISWSAINAASCTASGSWSGTLAASGTQTLKPTAAGTDSYSLTCANAAGTSPAGTATLTVTAAADPSSSGGGGGGGALGGIALLGLAALRAARLLRGRMQVH